jgi:hypothetical protein
MMVGQTTGCGDEHVLRFRLQLALIGAIAAAVDCFT